MKLRCLLGHKMVMVSSIAVPGLVRPVPIAFVCSRCGHESTEDKYRTLLALYLSINNNTRLDKFWKVGQ